MFNSCKLFVLQKKCMRVCCVCMLIGVLCACSNVTVKQKSKPVKEINELDQITQTGNTQGNILNKGFVAKGGGWIYGTVKGIYLSRMSLDGKMIEDLSSDTIDCDCVNVVGNYIFYRKIKYDDQVDAPIKNISYIYRMDIRTKKSIRVSDEPIEYYYLYKGKLYFSVDHYVMSEDDEDIEKTEYEIYQMDLDGSSKKRIYHEILKGEYYDGEFAIEYYDGEFAIDNDCIYFIRSKEKSDICKYDMASKKLTNIINAIPEKGRYSVGSFILDGENIFFEVRPYDSDNSKIYRMSKNGDNIKFLISDISAYNVDKNWIYFSGSDSNDYVNKLYKMKKDGTDKMKISDIDANNLNIVDNWIYCYGGELDFFYKVSTDGSGKYKKLTPDEK